MHDQDPLSHLRGAAADLHHGLRQEKAKGDADALAHVFARAQESGAPAEHLSQITDGFPKIAEELLREEAPKRRRKKFRFRRHKVGSDSGVIPRGPDQRQLPPGSL